MRTRRSIFSSDPVSSLDTTRAHSHLPVLLHEAIDQLAIQEGDTVVDATLGGAGHARAIVEKLSKRGTFIGFDLDQDAIERTKKALADAKSTVHLIESNFRTLKNELATRGITHITKALFDLGWSSYQLEGRGFSFQHDQPLVMTYSQKPQLVTAATIVNEWQENSIADVLYGFGEERYSRKIAKAIVERRQKKLFTTSGELADFIKSVVPRSYAFGRIHPATRTFQALRIAVNDELGALQSGIRTAFEMLSAGGRIAVISFHSIEDRAVKQLFAGLEKEGAGKRLTPKDSKLPAGQAKKTFILPSREEIAANPRARSAKLRVFVKNFHHDKKTFENKQIPPLDISGEV